MTEARALAYRTYIATFIRDLQDIHPEATHRTNQHMAMHIYDFLRLFGPVHSWWCFPFECLIGQLQQLTTNHKFGMHSILWPVIYSYLNIHPHRRVGDQHAPFIHQSRKA
jgi:hypothetical protein